MLENDPLRGIDFLPLVIILVSLACAYQVGSMIGAVLLALNNQ